MTPVPWDQIAVYAVGALAALYLTRRLLKRDEGGCGGCGGCGTSEARCSNEPDPAPTLIQIEPARPRTSSRE